MYKVTLSLIGDHFDEVGEELTFWVEFNDVFSGGDRHRDPCRYLFALLFEFRNAVEGFSHALCDLLLNAFALSRGRVSLISFHEGFSPVLRGKPFKLCFCLPQFDGQFCSFRIGNISLRIVRNNLVIYQCEGI